MSRSPPRSAPGYDRTWSRSHDPATWLPANSRRRYAAEKNALSTLAGGRTDVTITYAG